MKATETEIRDAAEAVVTSWINWADAEGWDNNYYDAFAEALTNLEMLLARE